MNSKLHAVCDGEGRPLVMLLSEGRMSDYKGAALGSGPTNLGETVGDEIREVEEQVCRKPYGFQRLAT